MKEKMMIGTGNSKMLYVIGILVIVGVVVYSTTFVHAVSGEDVATTFIQEIIGILGIICNILGVIFALFGFVKIVTAHVNDDGPSTQRAATMMAVGVVLIIVGLVVLPGLKNSVASWINFSIS